MSPFGRLIVGRHDAYLRRVERAFRDRNWDRALRDAIALGGVHGIVSLALPRPRTGALTPSPYARAGGRTFPARGATETFTDIYRRAVEQLTADGEIEKAAYVLADLIGTPADAVHLLDRHGRHALAARLAEGRRMEPSLVVLLWWRAGDRRRAIDIADVRGAFPAVLSRIGRSDPDLATEVRSAWVRSRRAAGDLLGAIAVAWPDERLRADALDDIRTVAARGDVPAAQVLPYRLNLGSDEYARTTALTLLSTPDPDLDRARDAFLAAFADLPAADPAHDRELATASVRAMSVRPAAVRKTLDDLTVRADPLTAADLRKPGRPNRLEPLRHVFPALAPGDLPVYDAAYAHGRILLACGGHGVRLVTRTGRTAARWDVPAHRIVMADSGTRAMLVTDADDIHEFHRLDLVDRRVTRWASLRARQVLPGYDGTVLTIVDDDGIAFLRTDEEPRVIWRELDRSYRVERIARVPGRLSAILRTAAGTHELWRWDTPSVMLRGLTPFDGDGTDVVALGSGHLIRLDGDGLRVRGVGASTMHPTGPAVPGGTLSSDGDAYAVTAIGTEGVRTTVRVGSERVPVAELGFAGVPRMRASAGHLVFIGESGDIAVVSIQDRSVEAHFRTSVL
jgi:hypothetical protein